MGEIMEQDGRAVAAAAAASSALYKYRSAQAWQPDQRSRRKFTMGGTDFAYNRCRGLVDSSKLRDDNGHTNMQTVLRILADKPAVADIACGQGHTLALLETGQVRISRSGCGSDPPVLIFTEGTF